MSNRNGPAGNEAESGNATVVKPTRCPRCGAKPFRGRIGHDRACSKRHGVQAEDRS